MPLLIFQGLQSSDLDLTEGLIRLVANSGAELELCGEISDGLGDEVRAFEGVRRGQGRVTGPFWNRFNGQEEQLVAVFPFRELQDQLKQGRVHGIERISDQCAKDTRGEWITVFGGEVIEGGSHFFHVVFVRAAHAGGGTLFGKVEGSDFGAWERLAILKERTCIGPLSRLRIDPVWRDAARRENVVVIARIDRLVVAGSRRVAGASLGDRQG